MNIQSNNFKLSLKHDITPIKNLSQIDKNNLLLQKLGLANISEALNISISPDEEYIDISLKSNNELPLPIVFNIPIHEKKLNNYYNHPQLEELSNRYESYSTEYKEKIKEYSIQERRHLQENFPGLVFNHKIRMKSKPSYEQKIDSNISKNKNLFIDDIIGERIIISEYNGSRDPSVLQDACYLVAEALYDYRGETNFRMKHTNNNCKYKSDKIYLTKDYIKYPKDNGYESLHIKVEDRTNPDCVCETQIRTYDMEEASKKAENQAHSLAYKPRVIDDRAPLRVPKYCEITSFLDSDGNPTVYDLPIKYAFYNYYGFPLEAYRNQLYEIEKYVKLSDIRKKLEDYQLDSIEK